MNYGLYFNDIPAMFILAKDEDSAWKQIRDAGIRNKSNLFRLERNW